MLTFGLLQHRPEAIEPLAAGYRAQWPQWYGPQGPGDALADLAERASAAALPFAVVAFEADRPVGTAAVTQRSIASRAQLTPWLSGLWTSPPVRGREIAKAMIRAAMAEAAARGFERLYAATEHGRALFEGLGWTLVETVDEDGHRLAVLSVALD